MAFDSMSEFFAMGGYAFYVWLSVGICVLSIVLLIVVSVFNRRQLRLKVSVEIARRERIKKARVGGNVKSAVATIR